MFLKCYKTESNHYLKWQLVVAERVQLGARGEDVHVDEQHRLVVDRLRAFHDYHVTFRARAE